MGDLGVAVAVAAGAAFALSAAYYAVVGQPHAGAAASGVDAGMPRWKLAVEILRGLVVAAVVAGLAARGDIDGWRGGLALGLALWVGFPLVLWIGAIVHEGTPLRLAGIHAGDWLLKLLAVGMIVSAW